MSRLSFAFRDERRSRKLVFLPLGFFLRLMQAGNRGAARISMPEIKRRRSLVREVDFDKGRGAVRLARRFSVLAC